MSVDQGRPPRPLTTAGVPARASWRLDVPDRWDGAAVRRVVRTRLAAVAPDPLVDDVLVVVGELVSNTYSHAPDSRVLRVSWVRPGLRVALGGVDPSPVLCAVEGSRTALVLDRLCAGWGVVAQPGGPSEAWALVADEVS
jgi:hypothetical protein